MVRLFGAVIAKHQKKLPKQYEDEEHYKKKYGFKNGNYYDIQAQYTGEGVGGETHELFLKGAKKHEAILLILALYTSDNYKIEDKQPDSPTIYDHFRWYYQNGLSNADKKLMDLDLYFSYYSEGSNSDIQLKETSTGIVVRFGFGGCWYLSTFLF